MIYLFLSSFFLWNTRIREYRNTRRYSFGEYKNTGIREYKTLLLYAEDLSPASITIVLFSCLLVSFFSLEYKNTGIQEYETLVLLAGIAMPSAHKNIRLVFLFSCLLVFHHSVSSSSCLLNSIKDRLATCRAERGRAMLRRCRCSRQCL